MSYDDQYTKMKQEAFDEESRLYRSEMNNGRSRKKLRAKNTHLTPKKKKRK